MGQFSESISNIYTTVKGQWVAFLPALLVVYSFTKEAKVADPFLYKYQTEFQNLTATTLNGDVRIWFLYNNYCMKSLDISIFRLCMLDSHHPYLPFYRHFPIQADDVFGSHWTNRIQIRYAIYERRLFTTDWSCYVGNLCSFGYRML